MFEKVSCCGWRRLCKSEVYAKIYGEKSPLRIGDAAMELVGLKVKHTVFGTGIIAEKKVTILLLNLRQER